MCRDRSNTPLSVAPVNCLNQTEGTGKSTDHHSSRTDITTTDIVVSSLIASTRLLPCQGQLWTFFGSYHFLTSNPKKPCNLQGNLRSTHHGNWSAGSWPTCYFSSYPNNGNTHRGNVPTACTHINTHRHAHTSHAHTLHTHAHTHTHTFSKLFSLINGSFRRGRKKGD